jgi:hypothetical protein
MDRTEITNRTNVPDIEQFEAEAAETIGEMKALFNEFQKRLGEVVNEERISASEARNEAVRARVALGELVRQAKATADAQHRALEEVRNGWRLHVATDSKAAGEEIARAFGVQIASGLQQTLEGLSITVERATQRFGWVTALKWTGGIAIGIVLTVLLGLWAFLPPVEGLPWHYVRAAATELRLCHVGQVAHVCVATDDKPRMVNGPDGEAVVVRGM